MVEMTKARWILISNEVGQRNNLSKMMLSELVHPLSLTGEAGVCQDVCPAINF